MVRAGDGVSPPQACLEGGHVQDAAGPIEASLVHLVEHRAAPEHQVPAVFEAPGLGTISLEPTGADAARPSRDHGP